MLSCLNKNYLKSFHKDPLSSTALCFRWFALRIEYQVTFCEILVRTSVTELSVSPNFFYFPLLTPFTRCSIPFCHRAAALSTQRIRPTIFSVFVSGASSLSVTCRLRDETFISGVHKFSKSQKPLPNTRRPVI